MNWYYSNGGRDFGPISEQELHALAREGAIHRDTPVWAAEQPDRTMMYGEFAQPAPAAQNADVQFCSECGRRATADEMVRFGDRWVCADCKAIFTQKLREGAVMAGTRRYAGFWRRFCAVLVDAVITGVATVPIWHAIGVYERPQDLALTAITFPLSLLLGGLYEVFFLYRFSATPGKMLLGVRVVTASGAKLSIGRAAGRYAAKYLSAFLLLIGYLMAAFDAEKRALHDHIAGTRAVRA
jgi:uncharacterized RDD family membrane protein YckC